MLTSYPIQVLRSGAYLATLFDDHEVLQWSLCATGQAFSVNPLPTPACINNLSHVEPLGGNLLHMLSRPSLKQIDPNSCTVISLNEHQRSMLRGLVDDVSLTNAQWADALKVRDVFGLSAVDYLSDTDVLGGRLPLEQRVSDKPNRNFRGILLSLTKEEIVKTDLFDGLVKAREKSGVDLFPGLDTRNSGNLRRVLLNYFDSIHKAMGRANAG